ncbi:hypothetical protein EI94DRAFT_386021 [Lactarius quietus]|nr:hypothetical protein EI94DRAFT_386021 [Lactarius quietus]
MALVYNRRRKRGGGPFRRVLGQRKRRTEVGRARHQHFDPAEIDEMADHIRVQEAEGGDSAPPGTFKPYTISLTSNLLFMSVMLSKLPSPLTLSPLRFVTLSVTESSLTMNVRPDDLLQFLTVCPELEFFSFTGTMSEPVITPEDIRRPPPIVSLPRLRSLVLHSTLATRILLSHIHTLPCGSFTWSISTSTSTFPSSILIFLLPRVRPPLLPLTSPPKAQRLARKRAQIASRLPPRQQKYFFRLPAS